MYLPPTGGIRVNQMTRYRPVALLVTVKVTVPPMLFSWATLVMESRLVLLLVSELPSLSCTSAPTLEPNLIVTEVSRTVWPMSRIRPVPGFRPPSAALKYCWELQPAGWWLITFMAWLVFSSPLSLGLRASKPWAATGLISVVWLVVPVCWCRPMLLVGADGLPLCRNERAAAATPITTTSASTPITATRTRDDPPRPWRGCRGWRC